MSLTASFVVTEDSRAVATFHEYVDDTPIASLTLRDDPYTVLVSIQAAAEDDGADLFFDSLAAQASSLAERIRKTRATAVSA